MSSPKQSDNSGAAPKLSRRHLLKTGLATATMASTTGCLGLFQSSSVNNTLTSIREDEDTGLSESEYREFVTKMHAEYGEDGPWGAAGPAPDHGLSYRGAWTAKNHLTENGKPYQGDEENLVATAENLLVLLEIPGKIDENGNQHYLVWLWSLGYVPAWKRGGGLLDDTPVVTRIQPQFELSTSPESLMAYAPADRATESPVRTGIPSPSASGFETTYPLYQGDLSVVAEKTAVGNRGQFAIAWNGKQPTRQAVIAAAEVRWNPDATYAFSWNTTLQGSRSRLV